MLTLTDTSILLNSLLKSKAKTREANEIQCIHGWSKIKIELRLKMWLAFIKYKICYLHSGFTPIQQEVIPQTYKRQSCNIRYTVL